MSPISARASSSAAHNLGRANGETRRRASERIRRHRVDRSRLHRLHAAPPAPQRRRVADRVVGAQDHFGIARKHRLDRHRWSELREVREDVAAAAQFDDLADHVTAVDRVERLVVDLARTRPRAARPHGTHAGRESRLRSLAPPPPRRPRSRRCARPSAARSRRPPAGMSVSRRPSRRATAASRQCPPACPMATRGRGRDAAPARPRHPRSTRHRPSAARAPPPDSRCTRLSRPSHRRRRRRRRAR